VLTSCVTDSYRLTGLGYLFIPDCQLLLLIDNLISSYSASKNLSNVLNILIVL